MDQFEVSPLFGGDEIRWYTTPRTRGGCEMGLATSRPHSRRWMVMAHQGATRDHPLKPAQSVHG